MVALLIGTFLTLASYVAGVLPLREVVEQTLSLLFALAIACLSIELQSDANDAE